MQVDLKNTLTTKTSSEPTESGEVFNLLQPKNEDAVKLNKEFTQMMSEFGLDYDTSNIDGLESLGEQDLLESGAEAVETNNSEESIDSQLVNELHIGVREVDSKNNSEDALQNILNLKSTTMNINRFDTADELQNFKILKEIEPGLDFQKNKITLNGKVISKDRLIQLLKKNQDMGSVGLDDIKFNKIISKLEQSTFLDDKKNNNLTLLRTQDFLAQRKGVKEGFNHLTTKNKSTKVGINAFSKNQNPFENSLIKAKTSSESNSNSQKENQSNSESKISNILNFQKNDHEQVSSKELLFSNISEIHTKSRAQLISTISNYIEKNNVKLESGMELTVKHAELGEFKVQAENNAQGVQLKITSMNNDAHKFFLENKGALEASLKEHGVKLSQIKVVMSSDNILKMTSAGQSSFGSNLADQQSSQQHTGQNNSSLLNGQFKGDQGSHKRDELWNKYKEQFNQFAS